MVVYLPRFGEHEPEGCSLSKGMAEMTAMPKPEKDNKMELTVFELNL